MGVTKRLAFPPLVLLSAVKFNLLTNSFVLFNLKEKKLTSVRV